MLLKCHIHVSKFRKLSSGHRTRKHVFIPIPKKGNAKEFSSWVAQSYLTLVTPWTAAHQASLSITNFQSLLKFMSIESVTPSNHLLLCRPLFLLPSIFPRIRVFSKDSVLHIRWPKYCGFSFSITPSNEYPGLISLGPTGLISLQSRDSQESTPAPQFQSISSLALSFLYGAALNV